MVQTSGAKETTVTGVALPYLLLFTLPIGSSTNQRWRIRQESVLLPRNQAAFLPFGVFTASFAAAAALIVADVAAAMFASTISTACFAAFVNVS